jgi:hypothetical protein
MAATKLISVCCKLPNGLILQLQRPETQMMSMPGGGLREEVISRFFGDRYTLKGNAVPYGVPQEHMIIGGYAITPDIPEDFFNEWLKQNATSAIVKKELIFAHSTTADVMAHTKANASLKSGLEGADADAMPGIEKAKAA